MGTAFVAAAALTLSPPALLARAVAANEALYRSIDLTYESHYRLADGQPRYEVRGVSGEGVVPVQEYVATVRVVRQGPMHRALTAKWTDAGDGAPSTTIWGSAFDGATTRVREGMRFDAMDGARKLPAEVYVPHAWATGPPAFPQFPLSVVLAGEAREPHPGEDTGDKGAVVNRRVFAPAAVRDEPCVLVRCAKVQSGRTTGVDYYWLAVRKNYLPVRVESYLLYYSATMPVEVVTASAFGELRPGVWLPHRLTKVIYDELELRENHRAVVSNTTTTTVPRAALNPIYDSAFFRDLLDRAP